MRAAFWVLALFALAVALTLAARIDQGYVIVVYPPWRMELSFMLALALLAGLVVLAYAMLRLGQTALRLPDDVRGWHSRRRGAAADRALLDAVRAHLDGNATRADKLARKATASQAPDIAERLLKADDASGGQGRSWWQKLRLAPAKKREPVEDAVLVSPPPIPPGSQSD
ncbi:MAG: heme biosynthesis HemY N-terminal domain-containing protein [Gallionellaceae bacterium]|nr:heme biosynthesis HemY N-terminal domain-containing protein [Gallionellaceae bacterium]